MSVLFSLNHIFSISRIKDIISQHFRGGEIADVLGSINRNKDCEGECSEQRLQVVAAEADFKKCRCQNLIEQKDSRVCSVILCAPQYLLPKQTTFKPPLGKNVKLNKPVSSHSWLCTFLPWLLPYRYTVLV